jgi:hypothetical protein
MSDLTETADSTEAAHVHPAHPVLRMTAPLVALGASWAASKALAAAYRSVTGQEPPVPEDRAVSFARVLTWTVLTATTGAVIQLVVYRAAGRVLPDSAD